MADTDGTSSAPPPAGEAEAASGKTNVVAAAPAPGPLPAADSKQVASEKAADKSSQPSSQEANASSAHGPSDDDPVTAKTQPRKRVAALANTLQTGAALQQTWRQRGFDSGAPPASPASGTHPTNTGEESGVQQVKPSDDRPASAPTQRELPVAPGIRTTTPGPGNKVSDAAALADTQQDPQRHRTLPRAARSGKLSRTLRMEIKLGTGSPEIKSSSADTDPGSSASPNLFRRAAQSGEPQPLVLGTTQRVGTSPTDFMSARSLNTTDPLGVPSSPRPQAFGGGGGFNGTLPGNGFAARRESTTSAPPPLPRKRELRPGERTMVMSRRSVIVKDWLFVVLLVTALGVTASMLVSYRNQPSAEGGEEDTTSENALTEGEEVDPLNPPAEQKPAPAVAPRATELRSEPAGAEVVVSGAVVGNTPVRVPRESSDVEYTLRLNGFEPALVRVGSNSPATIHVSLRPLPTPTR